jgi:hypothetical protein
MDLAGGRLRIGFARSEIGVSTRPQGIPHQPNIALKAVPVSWLFRPQLRQEICGVLLHDVRNTADQTL